MKISLLKNNILNVLSNIQGITNKKTNLHITTCVLIETSENGIIISATDFETGFKGFYEANIIKEGKIAINSRKFFEILKDFPDEKINITQSQDNLINIGNEKVIYNILGMDIEEFPNIPDIEDISYFEINSIYFKSMIEKTTVINAGSDEKREHLLGVLLEKINENNKSIIRMVATDSGRLSIVDYISEKEYDFANSENKSLIIPKKGLSEVGKFIQPEGFLKIGSNDSNFIVKSENETFIVRLLEGEFPDYKGIYEIKFDYKIILDKDLFLSMLKRMTILSDEKYEGVIFKFEKDKLIITTTNPNIGESKEDIDILFNDKLIEKAYNPKYFIDTLYVGESQRVIINLMRAEGPCLLEFEDDKNFLTIIMQMKTAKEEENNE